MGFVLSQLFDSSNVSSLSYHGDALTVAGDLLEEDGDKYYELQSKYRTLFDSNCVHRLVHFWTDLLTFTFGFNMLKFLPVFMFGVIWETSENDSVSLEPFANILRSAVLIPMILCYVVPGAVLVIIIMFHLKTRGRSIEKYLVANASHNFSPTHAKGNEKAEKARAAKQEKCLNGMKQVLEGNLFFDKVIIVLEFFASMNLFMGRLAISMDLTVITSLTFNTMGISGFITKILCLFIRQQSNVVYESTNVSVFQLLCYFHSLKFSSVLVCALFFNIMLQAFGNFIDISMFQLPWLGYLISCFYWFLSVMTAYFAWHKATLRGEKYHTKVFESKLLLLQEIVKFVNFDRYWHRLQVSDTNKLKQRLMRHGATNQPTTNTKDGGATATSGAADASQDISLSTPTPDPFDTVCDRFVRSCLNVSCVVSLMATLFLIVGFLSSPVALYRRSFTEMRTMNPAINILIVTMLCAMLAIMPVLHIITKYDFAKIKMFLMARMIWTFCLIFPMFVNQIDRSVNRSEMVEENDGILFLSQMCTGVVFVTSPLLIINMTVSMSKMLSMPHLDLIIGLMVGLVVVAIIKLGSIFLSHPFSIGVTVFLLVHCLLAFLPLYASLRVQNRLLTASVEPMKDDEAVEATVARSRSMLKRSRVKSASVTARRRSGSANATIEQIETAANSGLSSPLAEKPKSFAHVFDTSKGSSIAATKQKWRDNEKRSASAQAEVMVPTDTEASNDAAPSDVELADKAAQAPLAAQNARSSTNRNKLSLEAKPSLPPIRDEKEIESDVRHEDCKRCCLFYCCRVFYGNYVVFDGVHCGSMVLLWMLSVIAVLISTDFEATGLSDVKLGVKNRKQDGSYDIYLSPNETFEFSAATYNLHLGYNREFRFTPDEMVDEVLKNIDRSDTDDLDFLCLQEVGASNWEMGSIDLLDYFGNKLGFAYGTYGSTQIAINGFNVALLSKYPIQRYAKYHLPNERYQSNMVLAYININFYKQQEGSTESYEELKPLAISCIHMETGRDKFVQVKAYMDVADDLITQDYHLVSTGDWNIDFREQCENFYFFNSAGDKIYRDAGSCEHMITENEFHQETVYGYLTDTLNYTQDDAQDVLFEQTTNQEMNKLLDTTFYNSNLLKAKEFRISQYSQCKEHCSKEDFGNNDCLRCSASDHLAFLGLYELL